MSFIHKYLQNLISIHEKQIYSFHVCILSQYKQILSLFPIDRSFNHVGKVSTRFDFFLSRFATLLGLGAEFHSASNGAIVSVIFFVLMNIFKKILVIVVENVGEAINLLNSISEAKIGKLIQCKFLYITYSLDF
jgi:hypothetical protein